MATAVGQQVVRTDQVGERAARASLNSARGFDARTTRLRRHWAAAALEDGGIDVVVLQVEEVEGSLGILVQQGVAPLVWKGSATLMLHQPTMDP